jgi:DNA-binding transcriptional regulator YiaG
MMTICPLPPHVQPRPRTSRAVCPAWFRNHPAYGWNVGGMTARQAKQAASRTIVPGVGERIRAARRKAEVAQHELGAAVGVSQATVHSWEQGERGIHLVDLLKVAEVLGVHPVRLLPVPAPNVEIHGRYAWIEHGEGR